MLAFLLASAGDFLGSYVLLRLAHRWWGLVPGAIVIGVLSGACSTLFLGTLMDVAPGNLLVAAIRAAMLHAILTLPAIFWLRWWLTPMR